MSFLPFVPACRRLREAAKAHAAGEMDRADYRALRRRVIVELGHRFEAADGSALSHLPITYAPGEVTMRRNREQQQHKACGTQIEQRRIREAQPPPVIRAGIGPPLLLIALTLILLVVSASALAQVDLIPAVRDRAPNPEQAMVLRVDQLQINYLDDMPGLNRQEVAGLVADWLDQARLATEPTASHGFTDAELEDIAHLMSRLGVHSPDGLNESAVSAINTMTRRQQQRRGVSVVQLEQIAEELQRYLREQGWLVASAYVPAQEAVDGRVAIAVLPGRLAEVRTSTSTALTRSVQASLLPQLNQPLRSQELESLMYRLNSLPGIRAQGSLEAGDDVGTTRLNLQLDQQRRVASRFGIDDLGDQRSARFRLQGAVDIFNPLQRGDLLSLSLEQRVDNNSGTRGSLDYRLPVNRLGDALSFGVSINGFSVERLLDSDDDSLGDIDGQGTSIDVGYDRVLIGHRQRSLGVGVDLVWQDLELGPSNQQLWWLAPRFGGHWVLADSQWVLRGQSKVSVGQIASGAFAEQPKEFASLESQLSAWHPLGSQSVRVSLSAQLGTDDLPDSLKRSLGGPAGIASLRPGSFSSDRAVGAGLEFTATPARLRPFGELLLFGGWSRGQRELLGTQASARSWEAGVGWRLRSTRRLRGELRFAIPFNQQGLEADDDDPRLLFRLHYRP